jgi:hypothetical protein
VVNEFWLDFRPVAGNKFVQLNSSKEFFVKPERLPVEKSQFPRSANHSSKHKP